MPLVLVLAGGRLDGLCICTTQRNSKQRASSRGTSGVDGGDGAARDGREPTAAVVDPTPEWRKVDPPSPPPLPRPPIDLAASTIFSFKSH